MAISTNQKPTIYRYLYENMAPDARDPQMTLTRSLLYPANTKHLYNICKMLDQRRRRWADVVQVLYKCFVFAGYLHGKEKHITV